MILVDTNVISELWKLLPSRLVTQWFNSQNSQNLFISSISLAEVRAGIVILDEGMRKRALLAGLERAESEIFADRILDFDRRAARTYAEVRRGRSRAGMPIAPLDAMIAAIALSNRLAVATRDTGGFAGLGLELINPFEPGAV